MSALSSSAARSGGVRDGGETGTSRSAGDSWENAFSLATLTVRAQTQALQHKYAALVCRLSRAFAAVREWCSTGQPKCQRAAQAAR
jgi:hypothetical protein